MNTTRNSVATEVAVIGGGPTGLVSAIALAAAGIETILIAPAPKPDHRTTALLDGSVAALEVLGLWPDCQAHAAPLRTIRIIDDTPRLLRAPEIVFNAAEIGLAAFGYNIENRHLLAALERRAAGLGIRRIAQAAAAVTVNDRTVDITLADCRVEARLAVGADGQHSLCRAAAGIAVANTAYPQSALTLNLAHDRPHDDGATEFHTETGPFTIVPLPGRRSSLVCVSTPDRIAALSAMTDAALSQEVRRCAHSLLGGMRVEPGRGVFPLAVQAADTFGRDRIVLVGEAAHVLPPIGAQGLNLGLRDAATVAEIVAAARRDGEDVGGPDVMARYDAQRRADVQRCTIGVDLLNRALLSDFVPVHGARGLSLYVLDRVGPLRRALMREGVTPTASQPRLMRGEMV
jgi:2-octaprenyl-6-methoxyphenol hydroxylase